MPLVINQPLALPRKNRRLEMDDLSSFLTVENFLQCKIDDEIKSLPQCKYSTIVPINRIHFFARGLYHGFNYNYSDAIHILTPQIENMVRILLKNAGINTSKMSGDQDLLESEIGLSNLLRIPEISEIMDEDLIFNLKAIFAEKPGPNFRNEIAHGLLEETVANSHLAAYAWWFVFSLVVKFNTKVKEKVQVCKDKTA